MAYVSKDMKAKIAPVVKEICKRYGVSGTLSVRNHTALVLTVSKGKIDFIGNVNRVCKDRQQFRPAKGSISVNPHWFQEHFDGDALAFLSEVIPALKGPDYFDDSDIQSDYFSCSHYIDVSIGKWDKPYNG